MVSGVYSHVKLAMTASRRTVVGCASSKKTVAPGWDRSSTRRFRFGMGQAGSAAVEAMGGIGIYVIYEFGCLF